MPEPASKPDAGRDSETKPLVEGEDFYREGPYVVFTEAYHRRRGILLRVGMQALPLAGVVRETGAELRYFTFPKWSRDITSGRNQSRIHWRPGAQEP